MNLTVMLVLTTMFIGSSEALPKTAYIKMVDIWFIVSMIVPFLEVLLQTYIESLRCEVTHIIKMNHHGMEREVDVDGHSDATDDRIHDVTSISSASKPSGNQVSPIPRADNPDIVRYPILLSSTWSVANPLQDRENHLPGHDHDPVYPPHSRHRIRRHLFPSRCHFCQHNVNGSNKEDRYI